MEEALEKACYDHSKTPVMWLQEICVKQGCAYPNYQEKDLRSHISEPPNFEVTATVVNFLKENTEVSRAGTASTKKVAKQKAALNLLFQLGIKPTDLADIRQAKANSSPSPYSIPKPEKSAVAVAVPMETDVVIDDKTGLTGESLKNENVDGGVPVVDNLSKLVKTLDISPTSCMELLDLCGKRGLPNPEYKELKEEGPPHCKKFYMECRIKTANGKPDFVVTVCENQKKKAKNLSAATMLRKIQSEVHTGESIEELLATVQNQLPEPSRAVCTDKKRCHNLIAHLHHRYHHLIGQAILDLHSNNPDVLLGDYEESLNKIAVEEKFKVSYIPVPGISDLQKHQCYAELVFSKTTQLDGPPAVCVGEGESPELARKSAALEAIMFLKVVSKP